MDFFDLRKDTPTSTLIESWVNQVGIDTIFNNRGTKYRTLKLKDLNLDDYGKFQWLCKEPMLLKRPIVEKENRVLAVGFNEDEYRKLIS